jgi:TolA-binding protein
MLLAANISLLEWVLLGTILACGGGVLWRTFGGGAAGRSTSPAETEESERAQARAEGRIAQLEVRLHDFAREVEARMETRALQLDSLVVAGDREIVRLSTILNQLQLSDGGSTRQPDVTHFAEPRPKIATATASSTEKSVSPAQVEMVGHLNEAGFSVAEIAQIIGRAPDVVSSLLKKAA